MNNQIKTILLVEDEAITSVVTTKTLLKFGYNVITADSGQNAVDTAIINKNINLILMDIDLGDGIDGTEAALIILKTQNIPVVFLSSHTEPEVVEKTEKITSYGYVVKNTGSTVLDASIKMAFKLFDAHVKIIESEKRIQAAQELAHIGVWDWSADTDTVVWTEELYRIAGLDPMLPAPTYADHSRLYSPKSWLLLKTSVEKTIKTGEPYKLDLKLIRPDGNKRYVKAFGGAKYDFNGKITGLYGTVQDITELKQTEEDLHTHQIELKMQNDEFCNRQEELQALNEKYVDLYNSAPASYLTISEKGFIIEANLHATSQLGMAQGALKGQPFTNFIFKEDQDTYYLYRKKLLETRKQQTCEVRISCPDGTIFPACITSAFTKDNNIGTEVRHVVIINRSV